MSFRFRDFKVYTDSILFHKKIVSITKKFPSDLYYLKDQLRRASLSIILNIAEGSAKISDKDFRRYLENSIGSINELIAGLDVSKNLNLIDDNIFNRLATEGLIINNQLGGLIKKLKNDIYK